jgi:hypothetical protein
VSEYQYYEFRAVDRPLGERDMAALRQITSRAEITPTSLVNVYHFGDFRGDPDRLMDRYFDAHLYVANWGTRRLMLRLPADSLDPAALKPYRVRGALEARFTDRHVVLDFRSEDEGGDDYAEAGDGWLDKLIPLRSDLLTGDLRCVYLGWLAGVGGRVVEEDDPEPPVPPGLGKLSAPLKRLADFLRVDQELSEEAAALSGGRALTDPAPEDVAAWVAALSPGDKDRLLVRVVRGEVAHPREELLRRFLKERQGHGGGAATTRRTAGDLLHAAERRAEAQRLREAQRAAKERERRAREEAAPRARHLESLAGRETDLWQQAEAAIATRQPKEYDRAVGLLKDLRDLAERTGAAGDVAARLRQLRQRHRAKSTLIRRLNQAGFR